jgi:uncharacterized membrane protein YhaH (DUF805 family)
LGIITKPIWGSVMSKIKARVGEIHPFLTKVETLFFPLKNRINRKEYLWGFAKGLGCFFVISVVATLCKVGLVALFPGKQLNLFSSLPISIASWLFFYMLVRADYYRIQDFNLTGNIAYFAAAFSILAQYTLPAWGTIKLESGLSGPGIAFYTYVAISTVYCLMVFFTPGTKDLNKYGPAS